jgi:ankyrin repeat protein
MVASGFGHADIVEVLLKHGASKSPKLKFDGKTALDLARLRHSGNQRLLDLLA